MSQFSKTTGAHYSDLSSEKRQTKRSKSFHQTRPEVKRGGAGYARIKGKGPVGLFHSIYCM